MFYLSQECQRCHKFVETSLFCQFSCLELIPVDADLTRSGSKKLVFWLEIKLKTYSKPISITRKTEKRICAYKPIRNG
jgi:hypothetical protein